MTLTPLWKAKPTKKAKCPLQSNTKQKLQRRTAMLTTSLRLLSRSLPKCVRLSRLILLFLIRNFTAFSPTQKSPDTSTMSIAKLAKAMSGNKNSVGALAVLGALQKAKSKFKKSVNVSVVVWTIALIFAWCNKRVHVLSNAHITCTRETHYSYT